MKNQILDNNFNSELRNQLEVGEKIIWEGTQDWDTLLLERAAVTGQLVLSNYAKNALEQFKKK